LGFIVIIDIFWIPQRTTRIFSIRHYRTSIKYSTWQIYCPRI